MSMPDREEKCYFCSKQGIWFGKTAIDIDIDHDDEGNMTTIPLYGKVWLCKDHKEDYNSGEGNWEGVR